ncbi:MAG TPA: tetratricopeptide repeat protein [bacterium]|nr:tetratricopeptide repeat protein [bacterium]HQI48075.1 tetratricopeptide repeat protein [bacterium]HQJ63307.1 tetratricopeptide repeat protein [bacterium]
MKRITYLLAWLSLAGVFGCTGSRELSERAPELRHYNREAMRHIINGTIEDVLGDPKSALVEYHQAAEIDSASTGIYLALAENYFFLEEFNSSIRMARKALLRDDKNRDALELLAANYEKQRLFNEAAQVYEQMDKLVPNNLETLYSLTTLQIINKNYDKALLSYHRLVAAGLVDPEYRLRIGHLFFQHQAYDQARAIYQDVQRSDPDFEGAWLALGAVSTAKKDTTETIRIYRSALERQNDFEEVKAGLQLLYERSGRLDEAIALFQDLVRRDSTNLGDKVQLGQYLFQKKDTLAAAQWFEKIVAEHPQSERSYLALGALRRAQRDTAAAIQVYETAIKTNPLFLDARRRLRDLYVARKRWPEAIALYEALTSNDSTYVGARIEIANLLAQKGDTLQAIATCEALEKDHGEDWRVPVTLGRLLMVRSQNSQARLRFEKALALRKDLSLIWVLAGVNLAQMDSLQAAEKHFTTAVGLFPEDPEINYYLGFISNQLGKREQALRYLEKAHELDGNNLQTMLALAALYDEVQNPERAARLYQALLKDNPESAIVLNNYAYHLAERKLQLDDARTMAEKALSLDPENGAYWDTLGWILFQQGDFAGAREKVEKAVALSRKSAEVWEHLGDILSQLNQQESARNAYQQALALEPERQEVKMKLQKLVVQEEKR